MSTEIESDKGCTPYPKSPFSGIGKSFRSKIDSVKEYEILEENEEIKDDYFYGMPFGLGYNEYLNAQKLKSSLITKYRDMQLSEAIKGNEASGDFGCVFTINEELKLDLKKFSREKAKEKMLSELRLLYGIGDTKKKYLNSRGYQTIEDLIYHPAF